MMLNFSENTAFMGRCDWIRDEMRIKQYLAYSSLTYISLKRILNSSPE